MAASTTTFSQIQIGAQASYLKGGGTNSTALWGGGAHLKFFIGDHIVLGGLLRIYPEKTSVENYSNSTGTYQASHADLLSNLMGTFDLLLGRSGSLTRPYIGLDAGISNSSRSTVITSPGFQSSSNENKQTFFMASPKAGFNVELSKGFGLFAQAQYNLTFGSGDPNNITVPGFDGNSTTPVDKFFSFDAGIFFRFVRAGKK